MKERLGILVLLAGLAGCHPKAPAPTPEQLAATAAAEAADTIGCRMMGALTDDGADTLLAGYLARDGRGDFARPDPWLDTALTCPGQVPQWDGFTLVAGERNRVVARAFDSVAVEVTYDRRGFLDRDSTGFVVRPAPSAEVDTFVVVQTPFGWRIDRPVQEPHLLPAAALRLKLDPDYRTMIARMR
jgi:hypothetical protein